MEKGIAKRGFHFCALNILTILELNSKSKVKINPHKFHRATQAEIMNHTLLELLEVRSERGICIWQEMFITDFGKVCFSRIFHAVLMME